MALAPKQNDGFNTLTKEGKKMADTVDVSADCVEITLKEGLDAHSALMTESRGNAQSSHSIVRHSGARKFNQEDPIEAAATEMILKRPS